MSEHSGRQVFMEHRKFPSGSTNIVSYFLTGKELRLTWFMIICNLQEQQIIEKVGFPQMIFANTQLISTQIRFTSHTLLTEERILISSSFCSKVIVQIRLTKPIIWPIASRHFTHNTQNCNDFWLPGAESFSNRICYEWFRSNNYSAATIP